MLLPQLAGVRAFEPVFFCALEAESASQHVALDVALACLALEDPSLHVRTARETGQLLLAGMGELHLEVAVRRLQSEFGVAVRVGRMRVAYRETIVAPAPLEHVALSERVFNGKAHRVELELTVSGESSDPSHAYRHPADATAAGAGHGGGSGTGAAAAAAPHDHQRHHNHHHEEGGEITIARPLTEQLRGPEREALLAGLDDGIAAGPLAGFPAMGIRASLRAARFEVRTPPLALRIAATEAAASALARASPALLEPIMAAEIIAPGTHVGAVLSDLSAHRRAAVLGVTSDDGGGGPQLGMQRVRALVPLAELIGYSTALRSLTHGEGGLSLEFAHYGRLDGAAEQAVLLDARGY
jgi:elongation factor G